MDPSLPPLALRQDWPRKGSPFLASFCFSQDPVVLGWNVMTGEQEGGACFIPTNPVQPGLGL